MGPSIYVANKKLHQCLLLAKQRPVRGSGNVRADWVPLQVKELGFYYNSKRQQILRELLLDG